MATSKKPIPKTLKELERQHPKFIPVPVCAAFLGMSRDGLRQAIEARTVPFGICWKKPFGGRRSFKIVTAKFCSWYKSENLAA